MLKSLLDAYDESLRITDKAEGRLPVHYACLHGSPFEISLLVSAEQRALVFKDSKGKTPMDLAHESSNPHREAILKRLEDRTRIVTESMIQKRKKQQKDEESSKSSSKRGGVLSDNQDSKRRSKSVGTSSSKKEQQQSYSPMSDSAGLSKSKLKAKMKSLDKKSDDQKRSKSKGKNKASKSRKKNRSGISDDASTSASVLANSTHSGHFDDNDDVNRTPKLKNGRGALGSFLESSFKDTSNSMSGNKSLGALEHRRRNNPSPDNKSVGAWKHRRKGASPENMLGSFLKSHQKDDDDDDDDFDHKSMGAKSLPAHVERRTNGHKKTINAFAFDDPLEMPNDRYADTSVNDDGKHMSPLVAEMDTEINKMDEQIRALDLRRQALNQECENVNDSVRRKEAEAARAKEVITSMQQKLAEIQSIIVKEQTALTLAETGIQLQQETLALHEIKLKAVDSEKIALEDLKHKMLGERMDLIQEEGDSSP